MAGPVVGGAAADAARRRRRFRAITVVIAVLLCEFVAGVGVRQLKRMGVSLRPIDATQLSDESREAIEQLLSGTAAKLAHSRELGWTIRPRDSSPSTPRVRGERSYAPIPPTGTVRIATFGDSFTEGAEVENDETWQHSMEREGGLEVMNYGVGGYGTDQAYLRWRLEGVSCNAQVVVLGVMGDNIMRILNTFRPFFAQDTGIPLGKPRFVLEGDAIRLLENPLPTLDSYRELLANPAEHLPRIGEHDHFYRTRPHASPLNYAKTVQLVHAFLRLVGANGVVEPRTGFGDFRPYNTRSEGFELMARICERFVSEVPVNGGTPVVFLFPLADDVKDQRNLGTACFAPLRDRLRARGIAVLNLAPALAAASRAEGDGWKTSLFRERGHYSPRGNAIVAAEALRFLREQGLIPPRPE